MKVLNIITGGLKREGITTTQLVFMKNIDKSNIEMNIAAVRDNDPDIMEEFKKVGCKVIEFPDRNKKVVKYFYSLCLELRKGRYDIVHVHGSSSLLVIELLAAKLVGVPVRIAHSRNTRCNYMRLDKIFRVIFYGTYTDALACGEDAGKWLFGNRPFTIIHNGKDFSDFNFSNRLRKKERLMLGINNKIVIGHVGCFNEQKNHRFLIRVFEKIYEINSNTILYLMGDGPLYESIKDYVNELEIKDSVIFAGNVCDVSTRLQAMDIMILPSLYEGLPNVVLEWQAEGLPCLISDTITKECAPTELVEFMSLEADPEKWAEKALLMLENMGNRAENAEKAVRALRKAGFDIKNNAKDLVKLYEVLAYKRSKKNRRSFP